MERRLFQPLFGTGRKRKAWPPSLRSAKPVPQGVMVPDPAWRWRFWRFSPLSRSRPVLSMPSRAGGLITVPALLIAGVPRFRRLPRTSCRARLACSPRPRLSCEPAQSRSGSFLPLGGAAFAGGVSARVWWRRSRRGHLADDHPLRAGRHCDLHAAHAEIRGWRRKGRLSPLAFAGSVGRPSGSMMACSARRGTFYLIGLILLCGFPLLKATAHTKLMNAASNLGALGFFLRRGMCSSCRACHGRGGGFGQYRCADGPETWRAAHPAVGLILVSLAMAMRLLLDPAHPFAGAIRGAFGI